VSCSIPLTNDTYQGFEVGTPTGWTVSNLNGVVLVSKDRTGTEGSVVVPSLLTSSVTPTSYFTTATKVIQSEFKLLGGSVTFGAVGGGSTPRASLNGTIGQTAVTGTATTRVIAHKTAQASSIIEVSAQWAPAAAATTDAAMLSAIGSCYTPEPAGVDLIVQDQAFAYPLPPNWAVHDEAQDSLTLDDGSNSGVSYALIQVAPAGVSTPSELLSWYFGQVGIAVGQVLGTYQLPNTTTVTGATQGQVYEEFTGTLNGKEAIHGMIYALTVAGGGVASGVIRMGVTATNLWNADNGEVLHVMATIQHEFTQDLQELEQLSLEWEQFDLNVQGFDDALTGIVLVKDPATGQVYEASYDSYTDGSDGPGYYGPNGQPLTVVPG
jgi:hypothetical protein